MMKSSWKQQRWGQQIGENNRGISGHIFTLNQRLNHAFNLGSRYSDKGREWHFADIEIQRLVIRSIDAFLDCISAETLQHPLIKESIADMVGALGSILQLQSEATVMLALNVAVKMVNILPGVVLHPYVLVLVHPLASLLLSHHLQVAVSCATSLKLILSGLSIKREAEVWEAFKEKNTVALIVTNIKDFFGGSKSTDYFLEMILLLSKIMWRWPPSRFYVWNDAKLMDALGAISLKSDILIKGAVLELYSSLALCAYGAQKLLEKGEAVLNMMEHCMASSSSISLQMEGFKLAQCLMKNEEGCSKVMKMCCEPMVKAIISGMSNWSSHSGKIPKEQMPLLYEACRLALITRWAGEHHGYFWKLGVHEVLLKLLLNNFHKIHQSEHLLSLHEQKTIVQEGLNANFLIDLRPFIWDILGGLATHCPQDFHPKIHGNELCLKLLIRCAGWSFAGSTYQFCYNDVYAIFRNESATRSVLMMVYSPSKYIASEARCLLSDILRAKGRQFLKHLLEKLSNSRNTVFMPYILQNVIDLMVLTCSFALPQHRKHVIQSQGVKILVAFMKWCLQNNIHVKRSSIAPHLHDTFSERSCCWVQTEDWDGEDIPLLLTLWGLAELMHHSGCLKAHPDTFADQPEYKDDQLVSDLQQICGYTSAPGPRWYAAYILSYFGFYGFPSKLGKRIGKVLDQKEFSDLELILRNGEPIRAHSVILMLRCPSLLRPKELLNEGSPCGSSLKNDLVKCEGLSKEVHLSAQVDHKALLKLLEYVYMGYLQAGVDLVKKLKLFARHCNLQCLLQMLCKKSPMWGTPVPSFDLAFALGPAGHNFSDIILEAEAADQIHWTCSFCSASVPHVHVHKVILWSSCDYLQALFRSGMQESHSDIIKVPVGWGALNKLVKWFYSNELPNPVSGCLWDNLESEEKLQELLPYFELCSLAELWLLSDVGEHCMKLILSCLDTARDLSIKVIQVAASFSLWRVAEAAAEHLAPQYPHLRRSGQLDELDDDLIEMVRVASVRLLQRLAQPAGP